MTDRKKLRNFSIMDMVEGLSFAMDLVSPAIANHHHRVAFICGRIAEELGLAEQARRDLIIAAMLHDCGALYFTHQMVALRFEGEDSGPFSITRHAEAGYQLLRGFTPFARVADIVRYHHHHWDWGQPADSGKIPLESRILLLADRLDILLRKCTRLDILTHRDTVLDQVRKKSGTMFRPDLIEPLEHLFRKDSFWLDIANIPLYNSISSYLGIGREALDCDGILEMTEIFSQIIDFRSNHTAYHSRMVSVLSGSLARLAGFGEEECLIMKIAGNLHDLGKLAIPLTILDKPGGLTARERQVINTHAYYTFRILARFRDMEQIRSWAAFHHERINGTGYPFRMRGEELDMGARIVAVADIYTALREERPYRDTMSSEQAAAIVRNMRGTALDPDAVDLLLANLPELEQVMLVCREHCSVDFSSLLPFLDEEEEIRKIHPEHVRAI